MFVYKVKTDRELTVYNYLAPLAWLFSLIWIVASCLIYSHALKNQQFKSFSYVHILLGSLWLFVSVIFTYLVSTTPFVKIRCAKSRAHVLEIFPWGKRKESLHTEINLEIAHEKDAEDMNYYRLFITSNEGKTQVTESHSLQALQNLEQELLAYT